MIIIGSDWLFIQKENDNASKTNFELKILKLRMQWNELILNKAKRNLFFEKQFHVQYDHEFLNFLFNKTLVIIEHINSYLPETQIDQVSRQDDHLRRCHGDNLSQLVRSQGDGKELQGYMQSAV